MIQKSGHKVHKNTRKSKRNPVEIDLTFTFLWPTPHPPKFVNTNSERPLIEIIILFQALLTNRFSRVVGMDDDFIGNFILVWNPHFVGIIHSTRFWLGSMNESLEFQVLSGIKVSYQNVFWPIFAKSLFVIVGISITSIACKTKFIIKLGPTKTAPLPY